MIGFLATGVPLGIVAVVVTIVVSRQRYAQRLEFLSMLALATERGTPLPPVLMAFAAEHRGIFRFEALSMVDRLVAGWSLPDAADTCRALIRAEDKMAIRLGWETQSLPTSLRGLLDSNEIHQPVWAAMQGKILYILFVGLVAIFIGTFLTWWVAPRFQSIFTDFEIELPWVTLFLFNISDLFIGYWILAAPLVLGLGFLLCYTLLRCMNIIQLDLPGIRRLKQRLHTAAILQSLALFAESGRPLLDGLKTLSRTYPQPRLQKRLREVLRDMNGGRDWLEALTTRHLIGPSDKAVLAAAQRVDNLPWAMREMAEANRRRLAFWAQSWIQVAFAVIIFAYGGVVGVMVLGFFLPLLALIQNLT